MCRLPFEQRKIHLAIWQTAAGNGHWSANGVTKLLPKRFIPKQSEFITLKKQRYEITRHMVSSWLGNLELRRSEKRGTTQEYH